MLNSSISRKSVLIGAFLILISLGVGLLIGKQYELESQINILEDKISTLNQTNREIQDELQETKNQLDQLQEENLALRYNITILQNQISSYQQETEITTVKIGYIATTTTSLLTARKHIENIIEPDLNEYAEDLGSDYRFEFVIEDAMGQARVHLERVSDLHNQGVDLIIGGGCKSQASASLSYIENHDLLLFSHSSTSLILAIPDDNFFRMAPDDTIQATAIARMMESYGIEAIVVFQRADYWADHVYNSFKPEWIDNGGVILEEIRYSMETGPLYFQMVEDVLEDAVLEYGRNHVGVLVLSFDEFVQMMLQSEKYDTLYSLVWFGSDGTALVQSVLDEAPSQAAKLKVYSTLAVPSESELYISLYDRYYTLTSQPYGFYSTCMYDTAFVIAKAVIQASSDQPEDVIPLIPSICNSYYGASGWCKLNSAGDRATANYQIWGYGDKNLTPDMHLCGLYDATTDSVTWYSDIIGFTPTGR